MRFLIPLALVLSVSALEDPIPKLQEIDRKAEADKAALLRTWLAKANLEALPAVKLGSDPKASESRAAEAAERVNNCLAGFRALKAGPDFKDDKAVLGRLHPVAIEAILEADAIRKAAPAESAAHR